MKKVAFIGQAPPKTDPARPFGRTYLYKWLLSVGITDRVIDKAFTFDALIDYFPGLNKNHGHLAPTKKQISEARQRLIKRINKFNPDIIVPVGKLSIQEALNKEITLEEVVGKKFIMDFYTGSDHQLIIIPFPHPSGASRWIHQNDNKELLQRALELLKKELFNN